MSKTFKCSGERIPLVQLSLEKKSCLRGSGTRLVTPYDIAKFVTEHYGCKPQEVFLSICFNTRNEVIAVQEVSVGGLTHAQVDPRVLFTGAVTVGASALVLVHNHPSGNPEPSNDDIQLTQQLLDGARLLIIRVLDHIVVARGGSFISFRQKGIMPQSAFSDGEYNPEAVPDEPPAADLPRKFICKE